MDFFCTSAYFWINAPVINLPLPCPPPPRLPPSLLPPQDVGILINGSVPDLVGSRVECEYGPGVSTSATVHLDSGPAQIQTCPLLPRENYQSILPSAGENEARRPVGPEPAASSSTLRRAHFQSSYMSACIRTKVISPLASQKAPQPLLREAPPARPGRPGRPPCLRYDSDNVSKCLTRAALFTCLLFPSDHLTVSVAIKVNGTSVVSGSFIIYDCERTGAIHPKTP